LSDGGVNKNGHHNAHFKWLNEESHTEGVDGQHLILNLTICKEFFIP